MLTGETLRLPDGDVGYLRRAGAEGRGTLVLAHANGLNAGAYRPVLAALSPGRTVVALDARGHGRTTLPAEPETMTRWDRYGEDIARILRALDPDGPLTLAGHSLGAVSALLAIAQGLDAERLIMVEPVVLPRTMRVVARTPLRRALMRRGIAGRAARRRNGWPDAGAVRDAYAGKGFFKAWDAAALDGYLARGLTEVPDGVRLSCDPAWEAATFAAQGHGFWRHLGAATERMPVHVLKARGRSTVPDADVMRLVRAGALVTEAEGGHMLPAERPAHVAAYIDMTMAGAGV